MALDTNEGVELIERASKVKVNQALKELLP